MWPDLSGAWLAGTHWEHDPALREIQGLIGRKKTGKVAFNCGSLQIRGIIKEIVYDDIKEIYTNIYMYMHDLLHHQGNIFFENIHYIFV